MVNQESVIKDYCSRYDLIYIDTVSKHFGYDYILEDRKGKQAIAEVKCRTTSRNKYPTYLISAHKVHCLISHSCIFGVPSLLIVRFEDDLGVWFLPKIMTEKHGKLTVVARTNEAAEPCFHVGMSNFNFIGLG